MTDRELMQQALDALANFDLDVRLKVIPALRARLAQPEQPQIVWIDNKQTGNFLNMAMPQREWQGLTDEEMFSLWVRCPAETEDRFAFARAIEAKLEEKNT